jgi:hypothetical protein
VKERWGGEGEGGPGVGGLEDFFFLCEADSPTQIGQTVQEGEEEDEEADSLLR